MVILDINVTHNELLDFATEIVNAYSTEKDNDITQINKYREIINRESDQSMWTPYIEGWVWGVASNCGVDLKQYIRKEKIKKLNNL